MTSNRFTRFSVRSGLGLLLPAVLLWTSCSNTKDTLITRTFHNLSAHYNGYYNAGIKVEEATDKLAQASQDHYDRILPVFQYGDAAKAKAVFPQLEDAMKRTRTVIERHTIIDKRGNEKPYSEKWIDDNHLLYGKCQFFKHDYFDAIETFKYVESTYKKEEGRHLGSLWLAKTYLELTQLREAEEKLDYVNNQTDFPKSSRWELAAVNADFYLQTKNFDKAKTYLTKAAALVKKRDTKIRWLFIIAQLHQQKGEFKQAFDLYTKVIKMNPKYELGFNARLNRARCSDGTSGNNEMVRKELNKMEADPKNKEFLDQIYFALAGLAKNEGKPDEQVELLNKSIRASTTNTTQKALSYLELGKIQFEKKEYRLAQAFYDSTTSLLTNDYPDYNEILNRRNSLTKLVKNLRVIENEDSLQTLAALSPAERQAKINDIIAKEEEARKKDQEEKQANQIFQQANAQPNNNFNKQVGAGNWYFYIPSAVSFGLNEFTKKFGERKLEDNWRRINKQTITNTGEDTQDKESLTDDGGSTDSTATMASADKRRAEMLKAIPADKEAIEKSTTKIIEAYYNVGTIYKEQLNDPEASASAFEKLLERFPASKYKLQCYYQLYRLYSTLGNQSKSDYYKNIILNQFGDTEYAEIIRNPNYVLEKANRKTELELFYEETYRKYLNGEYYDVIARKAQADQQFPKSILAPQFELLKALAIGKTQPLPTFEASLQEIVRNYSEDPVKDRAQEILDVIHSKGSENVEAPVKDNGKPAGNQNEVAPAPVVPAFKYMPDTTHYVVLIFQNIGGPVDGNKLKIKLSDFNRINFGSKNIQVQDNLFDARNKILILKEFPNRADALAYNNVLYDNDDVFGNTDPASYQEYVVSVNNLPVLMTQKKTDEYEDFYRNFYK
jgi:tetratricopeptide (TPR) repeat protein